MKFEVKLNDRDFHVYLIRKRNIKHTYLRVKSVDLIHITSNPYFTKKDSIELLEKKRDWILGSIERKEKNSLKNNEFYFLGIKHKNLDNRDLDFFYKEEAKKIISPIVEKYSDIMNLHPSSIKYRKNKNTWGSCNYKDGLNFNIFLVKFPFEVIEYVVIHELAHIKYKNHSKQFWKLVENYCNDYKIREKILKSFL